VTHLPLPDSAARQAIDSDAIFLEWLRVVKEAKKFAGGMYFKREGSYEYLVKTSSDNRQSRLGSRDERAEETLRAFTEGKQKMEARQRSLRESVRESERLNKALRVGRVPNLVVDVLNQLELAGLGPHFTVVGTHALYAYEAAASVRIEAGALATQDVDLLWDARKRVQFASTCRPLLPALGRADGVGRQRQRFHGGFSSAHGHRGRPASLSFHRGRRGSVACSGPARGSLPQRAEVRASGVLGHRPHGADAHRVACGICGVQALDGRTRQSARWQTPSRQTSGGHRSADAG